MSSKEPIRTLYVDDDEAARLTFRRTLEPRGFDVTLAQSGFEARNIAGDKPFDLVVSDVRMPGMDGITLTTTLHDMGVDAAFILVSGFPELDFRRGAAARIFATVSKPWNIDTLVETLERAHRFREEQKPPRDDEAPTFLLLLEDADEDAALIERALGPEGSSAYAVVRAKLARDAIGMVREAVFPVMITTLDLPDAHGINAVQRLHEESPESAIVVISKDDNEALGRSTIATGAQEFVAASDLGAINLPQVLRYALERKRAERRLAHLANRDAVTGLSNRRYFNERLSHLMRRARRKSRPFGVIYLDLDGFKPINDRYGHDAGDHVLHEIGQRMRRVVRDYDLCARLGGDEFAVLAEEPTDSQALKRMSDRLAGAVSEPIVHADQELAVGASIGAAVYPDAGESPEDLLKAADSAMYHSKHSGGSKVTMRANAPDVVRGDFQERVQQAARGMQFDLHFQPQVDVRSGTAVGVEALLRWESESGHFVSPGTFVPILESTGLIVEVGAWVIEKTCAQLRAWDELGMEKLRGSVNVAPRQFDSGDLAQVVGRALNASGIEPARLEIEITESTLMRNTKSSNETLKALKELGVRVAIDDFGTGYSSLSYLHRFQVDVLKIDRSFICELGQDDNGEAIASAIVSLSRRLGLEVVAEGVEDETQLAFLRREGCALAQGYYFSRPCPGHEIPARVALLATAARELTVGSPGPARAAL
ncbi:MAG: EAL domain-containing protein [Myxococcota bacterium]